MKKHLNYWLALALLLPALHACHDEDEAMPGAEPGTAGTPTVVRASIGDDGSDTRAQVQWGTQNVDDGEFFMWNAGDQFKAYDITTAERNVTPAAYTFSIDGSYDEATPSREADFTCPDFPSVAQHKIAALYGNFDFEEVKNESGMKGLFFSIQYSDYATQIQTDNPGNVDLKHLKDKMPMWATATAEGNGKISQVSFHHLSSLLRITLRNAGDAALQVEHVEIFSPNAIVAMAGKGIYLWEDGTMTELFLAAGQGATLYLENKDGNQYATIASGGGSYDCFLPVLARNDEYHSGTSSLTIKVKLKDDPTVKSVDIAGLNNFKIEAGMRYWFDLTVMADGTLAQTSSMQTNYAWYTSNKEATEFSISTPGELRALANLVNGTEEAKAAASVSGAVSFEGKTISLAGDINLGNEAWTPIGSSTNKFRGTFNGDGRHISGLNVNTTERYAGLFGWVGGGTVRNLRVSGTVKTTGIHAGGIAGTLVSGSTVENCIFCGDVSGDSNVGGIVGTSESENRIAGCHTKGTVMATNSNAGGIAGFNFISTIDGCYSEAEVTADRSAGGIAGDNSDTGNNSGNITYCYATGVINGKSSVGGIAGYQNPDGTLIGGIALNPGITRTSGSMTSLGRIAGLNNGTVTSSAAFSGMTLVDATTNTDITGAIGEAGDNLTAADCLAKDTYTSRGFTEATATTPGWAFDTATTWMYLPWNKVFEAFPGISETDYRIKVPTYLSGGTN